MKRLLIILAGLSVGIGLTAGVAMTGTTKIQQAAKAPVRSTIMIRHQLRGCHAWSINGSSYRAAQTTTLARRGTITFVDNDAGCCSATGLPLTWQVETARSHESMHVPSLLDALHVRGFAPETVAMDMGYDNGRVYAECAERNVAPIIPLRKKQGERHGPIARNSDQWRSLYRRRSAVEREFGRLKHTFGLAMLRVRGIERVRLHADLVMLSRLSVALARARAVSVAA
jgi:hypothetical protein